MSWAFVALTNASKSTLHLYRTLGGEGGGGSTYGAGMGFLRVMVYWYISNRLAGCVCNIRMPSVDIVCRSKIGQSFSKLTPPGP